MTVRQILLFSELGLVQILTERSTTFRRRTHGICFFLISYTCTVKKGGVGNAQYVRLAIDGCYEKKPRLGSPNAARYSFDERFERKPECRTHVFVVVLYCA